MDPRGHPEPAVKGTIRPLIELEGVTKSYQTGRVEFPALRGIDLRVGVGELVAVVGPSGSGKSTVLNIITGIDRPSSGEVRVTDHNLAAMSEEELAVWRGSHVGIVFQFFQLLPTLTALENVMLPLDFAGADNVPSRIEQATARLQLVGMADKLHNFPAELSGGEQQRVAIARALAADPALLVADEPTGNLDTQTAHEMFDVLAEINHTGTTIVYVTHDPGLARRALRMVSLRDGRIVDDRSP